MITIDATANSNAQVEFFAAPEYEVLFGGAAGGGKTWCLVVDPLRYIQYEGYTAIIFRRTFPELEGSILPLARKYYNAAGATYNEQKKTFTFPSGATVRLGFMQHQEDWQNYQGHEYAGQYFDELTNFHQVQYDVLGTWNRSKVAGITPYRRAATNPGGVGHAWVKTRFVQACPAVPDGPQRFSKPANMYWQPMKAGASFTYRTENNQELSRKFIPSRVFDNVDLLATNPLYLAQLLGLPPQKRKAFLEGDWDVFEGQFFSMWRNELHVIDPMLPPANWNRLGVIDYGERTVLECSARDYEGNIITFAESYSEAMVPSERFNLMADLLIEKQLWNLPIYYDTNMDISLKHYYGFDKTPAQIAEDVFRDRFKGTLDGKKPSLTVVAKATTDRRGYRVACNEAMKEYLAWSKGPDGMFTRRPKHYVTRDCQHLIRTLPELIHDPESPDGLDFDRGVGLDDPFDADKMALMILSTPQRQEKENKHYTSEQEYFEDKIFNPILERAQRPRITSTSI